MYRLAVVEVVCMCLALDGVGGDQCRVRRGKLLLMILSVNLKCYICIASSLSMADELFGRLA